jgi:hypothetical protein
MRKPAVKTAVTFTNGYIKINRDRGYGDGLFKVISEDAQHYVVQAVTESAQSFEIYKAHTYRDTECRQKALEASNEMKEKNKNIGQRR